MATMAGHIVTSAKNMLTRRTTVSTIESSESGLVDKCSASTAILKWIYSGLMIINVLALDLIFYNFLVPLAAIYFGGFFISYAHLNLASIWEIVGVVAIVFCSLSMIFKGRQESFFWRHFLSGENQFKSILMIRDAVNTICIGYFLRNLMVTLLKVMQDREMLERNLHEGVLYVTLSPYFDGQYLEEQMNVRPSYRPDYRSQNEIDAELDREWGLWDTIIYFFGLDEGFFGSVERLHANSLSHRLQNEMMKKIPLKSKAIHGAQLILTIAQLTAAVTKLLYFTSLFNYQRAMKIFIEMQKAGEFSKDEELEESPAEEESSGLVPSGGNQVENVEVLHSSNQHQTPQGARP